MILEVFSLGPIDTNSYLLGCSQTKKAVVIDTPFDCCDLLIKRAKKLDLHIEMILLSHSHWDHTAEAALLKEKLQVPIYVHEEDMENLKNPGSDRLPTPFPIKGITPDGYLSDGQILKIGSLHIKVIHTPGHTPGGVCFYLPEEKALISGDTLFHGAIGNLSLPTAHPERMWASLKKLSELPAETKVYPGHGEPTTIGEEMHMIDRLIKKR